MSQLSKPITDLSQPLFDLESGLSLGLETDKTESRSDRHFVIPGFSHVIGAQHEPLITKTIPAYFAEIVERYPNLDAVIFHDQDIRWTWKVFAEKVDALAAGLLALGMQRGDRVGIWSPNRVEWVLSQFATARIGAILVTVNPAYKTAELEHVLNQSGCMALITAPQFKSSNYVQMVLELIQDSQGVNRLNLRSSCLPQLKMVICMTAGSNLPVPDNLLNFKQLMSLAGPAHFSRLNAISAALDPNDAINIQFTSGTTGAPKGATLTHRNILNNANFTTATMNLSNRDRLCLPVPLYHCFGMVMGTLGCLTKGAAMVFPGEGFDPMQTLAAIEKERCTALYGVPTMFNAMLAESQFSEFDLSSLRTGVMAGAPCPIETMNRVVSDMHMKEVTIAYGMTETSPVSFQSNINDSLDKRVSTVGRVHPHVECCMRNTEGEIVPVGEKGELCTRGYSVMKGYWEDEERTKESIDVDGWMRSGDLAVLDEEGFCNIVGRVKDMIIRGGENVYPKEIEDFLYRHAKIKDVQVFGVPDKKYGEEICAWVVPKEAGSVTEEELKQFCDGQIAHYKIPRFIRIKKDLPMTVSGKAQKFKMRDTMIEELNLEDIATA